MTVGRYVLRASLIVGSLVAVLLFLAFAPGASVERSSGPLEGYYVDGVRPAPDATGPKDGDHAFDGCVQWSADRPDVHICGDIPDGWTPAPAPGTADDHPEVCDTAWSLVQRYGFDGLLRYELDAAPVLDRASCRAAGTGTTSEATWTVTFAVANPEALGGYRTLILRGLVAGVDQVPPAMLLSRLDPDGG